jgi:hypothetical protein
MKKLGLYLAFAFPVITCFPQEQVPLCHLTKDANITFPGLRNPDCGFTDNEKAYREVEKIMDLAGLPMNFTVCKKENLKNAYAVMDSDGNRFIVYDDNWLKALDTDSSRLETITALAHEIGHHLSGHTLAFSDQAYHEGQNKYCQIQSNSYDRVKCKEITANYLKERREEELEADRFAGFIMSKYGASLAQITRLYYKIASNLEDSLSDHPNLSRRIAAVQEGYELAALYKGANITYVDLEKIKGREISIDISDLSEIERNKLIEKVRYCIQEAGSYVEQHPSGQEITAYSGGPFIHQEQIISYIGTKDTFWLVDKPEEYFCLANYFVSLRYDQRVKFYPQPAIHVKNGILRILVFGVQDTPKVVYHAPFKENRISLEEIKVIFIEIFRAGIKKETDKFYSHE